MLSHVTFTFASIISLSTLSINLTSTLPSCCAMSLYFNGSSGIGFLGCCFFRFAWLCRTGVSLLLWLLFALELDDNDGDDDDEDDEGDEDDEDDEDHEDHEEEEDEDDEDDEDDVHADVDDTCY